MKKNLLLVGIIVLSAFGLLAISFTSTDAPDPAPKKKEVEAPKPKLALKVGDRVRMEDGRAIGSIDKIEKNKAVVNYGMFTTNVSIEQLELVETKK